MNKFKLFLLFLTLCSLSVKGQDTLVLTLDKVVEAAREHSPAARIAKTNFSNRYWQYKSFRANYRPQLRLNTVIPDLNRSISQITLDDGSDIFIRRSLSTSSIDLSLSQNIGPTGSEVFISSSLQRIDVFTDPTSVSYLANPALIGIRQPLFTFNPLRWDLRIEPLRYEEAKKQLNEDMETVSLQAVELFFRVLQQQNALSIHSTNVRNNDTLYTITKGRYNLGKIAENDLLQMELNLMNARNDMSQAQMDLEIAVMRLLNFLKLSPETNIRLLQPTLIPDITISDSVALYQARKNRPDIIELERMKLEADRQLHQAKSESRINADVFATYGLTESAPVLSGAYETPQDQQRVRVGVQIPLLTWGKNKARVQTARANMDLTLANAEQSLQSFEQDVVLLVKQFDRYKERLRIAALADTIARRRFEITMSRYLIGKVGILDLNLAIQEKVQAQSAYLFALESFWNTYFEIRRRTLYDFLINAPITYVAP